MSLSVLLYLLRWIFYHINCDANIRLNFPSCFELSTPFNAIIIKFSQQIRNISFLARNYDHISMHKSYVFVHTANGKKESPIINLFANITKASNT